MKENLQFTGFNQLTIFFQSPDFTSKNKLLTVALEILFCMTDSNMPSMQWLFVCQLRSFKVDSCAPLAHIRREMSKQ